MKASFPHRGAGPVPSPNNQYFLPSVPSEAVVCEGEGCPLGVWVQPQASSSLPFTFSRTLPTFPLLWAPPLGGLGAPK